MLSEATGTLQSWHPSLPFPAGQTQKVHATDVMLIGKEIGAHSQVQLQQSATLYPSRNLKIGSLSRLLQLYVGTRLPAL